VAGEVRPDVSLELEDKEEVIESSLLRFGRGGPGWDVVFDDVDPMDMSM